MTDTHIAKLMWDAYAIQAGWDSFDGKPLPAWDELSEDRQSCWVAAASITADRIKQLEMAARGVPMRDMAALSKALDRIEKLEAALRTIYKCCDETGNCSVVRRIASKALETDNDRL